MNEDDSSMTNRQFQIFHGDGRAPAGASVDLPPPPPWRRLRKNGATPKTTFVATDEVRNIVNAALHLRRPILITGDPGTGKSSVAYAIADELGLNPVIKWPINSRSSLKEGLYHYDALARLQDSQLARSDAPASIGDYITLGPLGTAISASRTGKPRVLLIDEIDKSDIDLPNDLLHIFEDGYFSLPELLRLPPELRRRVEVFLEQPIDGSRRGEVLDGVIACEEFPIVILTSNGERELPPAFHRRCLRLDLRLPEDNADGPKSELHQFLLSVVKQHLEGYSDELQDVDELISKFRRLRKDQQSTLAIDQLLQAVFLMRGQTRPTDAEREALFQTLLRDLRS